MTSPIEIPVLKLTDKDLEKEIIAYTSCLFIDDVRGSKIKDLFIDEMRLGLAEKPEKKSSLLMENTFVRELANGTEHGTYLALDLGGTNLRVIVLTYDRGQVLTEIVDYFDVPENIRMGEGEHLFDHIAQCVQKFLHNHELEQRKYDLGFTFSFPMTMKSVDVGILSSWTKSYKCPGVVNENIVGLLNKSLKKNKINCEVTVILNDTTGTLVQGSATDKRCAIGMILGTGCNACYLEKVTSIKKWTQSHTEKEVIIDIEWGAFGDNGILDDLLKTPWDVAVDQKSLISNSFTFEKYIAGKYLGDIGREVLVSLGNKGFFCKKSVSRQCLEVHGSLSTKCVGTVEGEAFKGQTTYAKDVLRDWGLDNISEDDITVFQYVCAAISYRSVLLVCLLTSVLLERMDKPHCTIAIDGSLFQHHPRFRPLMHHLISKFVPKNQFSLLLSRDGSGKGAGLVAAVVDRLKIGK